MVWRALTSFPVFYCRPATPMELWTFLASSSSVPCPFPWKGCTWSIRLPTLHQKKHSACWSSRQSYPWWSTDRWHTLKQKWLNFREMLLLLDLLDCKCTNFMVTSSPSTLNCWHLDLMVTGVQIKQLGPPKKNQHLTASSTLIHPEPSRIMLESKDLIVPTALVAVPSSV